MTQGHRKEMTQTRRICTPENHVSTLQDEEALATQLKDPGSQGRFSKVRKILFQIHVLGCQWMNIES